MLPISGRKSAGQRLAAKLKSYGGRPDVTVLALPRGGVPVAFEIAGRLHAALDILVVRKVGLPTRPELAMGAVVSGGVRVLDRDLIRSAQLPEFLVDALVEREEMEITQREALLRDGHAAPDLSGRTVIVVDDGMATGSTMLAAVMALRAQRPREIVIAVPVGSAQACGRLAAEVDVLICLATPEPFYSVGKWYKSFPQLKDEEVKALLSVSGVRTKALQSGDQVPGAA